MDSTVQMGNQSVVRLSNCPRSHSLLAIDRRKFKPRAPATPLLNQEFVLTSRWSGIWYETKQWSDNDTYCLSGTLSMYLGFRNISCIFSCIWFHLYSSVCLCHFKHWCLPCLWPKYLKQVTRLNMATPLALQMMGSEICLYYLWFCKKLIHT